MGRDRLEREGLEGRRVCFQLSPVEQSAELSWGWFTPQKFLPYSRKVVLCFNSKQLVFIEPFFFFFFNMLGARHAFLYMLCIPLRDKAIF